MSTPCLNVSRSTSARQSSVPACAGRVVYLPDALFDHWMPRLSGPALRVLIALARATYGRRQATVFISLSSLQTPPRPSDPWSGADGSEGSHHRPYNPGCGIRQRGTLIAAIATLEQLGLIAVLRDEAAARRGVPHRYSVRLDAGEYKARGSVAVPAVLIDRWMAVLSDTELRVALYVCRRTCGWGKEADVISMAQFTGGIVARDGRVVDGGCGLRRPQSVYAALALLERRGLLTLTRRRTPWGASLPPSYALTLGDAPQRGDTTQWGDGGGHDDPHGHDRHDAAGGSGMPGGSGATCAERTPTGAADAPQPVRPASAGWCVERPPAGAAAAPQQDSRTQERQTKNMNQDRHADTRACEPACEAAPVVSCGTVIAQPHDETTTLSSCPELSSMDQQAPLALADVSRAAALPVELLELLNAIGVEMGDRHADLTRRCVGRLWRDGAGGDTAAVVAALMWALDLTRERWRCGGVARPMPYLLAVCADVLRPHETLMAARQGDEQGAGPSDAMTSGALLSRSSPLATDDTPSTAATTEDDTYPEWQATLAVLRTMITPDNYRMWLAPTHVLRRDGNTLRVATADACHQHWLDHRLRVRVEQALEKAAPGLRVTFEINADPSAARGAAS